MCDEAERSGGENEYAELKHGPEISSKFKFSSVQSGLNTEVVDVLSESKINIQLSARLLSRYYSYHCDSG